MKANLLDRKKIRRRLVRLSRLTFRPRSGFCVISFEIFAVSVAKWNRRENVLFLLMRTVSAFVRDPTDTAIIIPSECGSIQRRLCARYKYLWASAYFLHTWVGGYARYRRPNWMSVGANLYQSYGHPLFAIINRKAINNLCMIICDILINICNWWASLIALFCAKVI